LSAKTGSENLLALSVEAAKARATVGEISKALEDVFGRHVPKENIVRGAYSKEATTKAGDKGKSEFENSLSVVRISPRMRDVTHESLWQRWVKMDTIEELKLLHLDLLILDSMSTLVVSSRLLMKSLVKPLITMSTLWV